MKVFFHNNLWVPGSLKIPALLEIYIARNVPSKPDRDAACFQEAIRGPPASYSFHYEMYLTIRLHIVMIASEKVAS